MRRYIAGGLGFKVGELPGFEGSVLSLAVEAKMQRAEVKRLRSEQRGLLDILDAARTKVPVGTVVYGQIIGALKRLGIPK